MKIRFRHSVTRSRDGEFNLKVATFTVCRTGARRRSSYHPSQERWHVRTQTETAVGPRVKTLGDSAWFQTTLYWTG